MLSYYQLLDKHPTDLELFESKISLVLGVNQGMKESFA